MRTYFLPLALAIFSIAQAELRRDIGSNDFSDWSGISRSENNTAVFQSGKTIAYTFSEQNRIYPGLMRDFYGDSVDWYGYVGISFDVLLENESTAEVNVVIKVDPKDFAELNPQSTAKLQIAGQGWQRVYLPFELFNVNVGQRGSTLQAVKTLEITITSAKNVSLQIRKVQTTKGEVLHLESPVQGKAVAAGELATYTISVGNTTETTQAIQLFTERIG